GRGGLDVAQQHGGKDRKEYDWQGHGRAPLRRSTDRRARDPVAAKRAAAIGSLITKPSSGRFKRRPAECPTADHRTTVPPPGYDQYDLGRPSTCSAKKLRIRFVEIGATW